jgi:hypothetical protein
LIFSRYLCCRFDLGPHFRAVKYAPEVPDVVTFGSQPAAVADTLLAGLKFGNRVVINAGSFRGVEAAIYRGQRNRERVAVMLSRLASNEQKLVIDRSQVTRIA